MSAPKNRGYKRSWRNLLLDKGYQLRFTMFMVIMAGLLMVGLGAWVLDVADSATTVALDSIRARCTQTPVVPSPKAQVPDKPRSNVIVETTEMTLVEPGAELPTQDDEPAADKPVADKPVADEPAADGADKPDDGEGDRPRAKVALEPTQMEVFGAKAAQAQREQVAAAKKVHDECLAAQTQDEQMLSSRKRLIFWVLIGVGSLLVVGLFGFGIKMTHRVAGPLFKVKGYFAKLRDDKYDEVYNLRKGDRLMEFYAVFKSAHDGLRQMQEEDVQQLTAMIAAAERADLASKSPEIAAVIDEMRTILRQKEDSLV